MARGDLIQLSEDVGMLILTSDSLPGSPLLTGMLATRSDPTTQTLPIKVGETIWSIHLHQIHTIDRRATAGHLATCPPHTVKEATATLIRSLHLYR